MLAELAIANAAFGVIKETIANGGDIMAAGQHIFKFFDNNPCKEKLSYIEVWQKFSKMFKEEVKWHSYKQRIDEEIFQPLLWIPEQNC